ncbi:hypothetical protein RR48_10355 [Papilio machaon]|uniref:Uncharacterized protein n=1 Tax=Papilio machaon TaxID=76193 RepID=A0A194RL98_PAPMA|nr:hypothetical protein RR48_10355 [Papilio machaon]
MQCVILFVLVGVAAVALADGQFYVPRAYYTIDAEGHASAPVPLRRLRRSLSPYPYGYGGADASATANANANSYELFPKQGTHFANRTSAGRPAADGVSRLVERGGGDARANANANAYAGAGGWSVPQGAYGAANPAALSVGGFRRQFGPVSGGRSVSASSSVGLDSSGQGYYDQYTSVSN